MCVAPLYHCGTPCRTLAERICACQRGQREQRSCLARIDAAGAKIEPTPKEEAQCQALLDAKVPEDPSKPDGPQLDACSCETLAQGDFVACGLARD